MDSEQGRLGLGRYGSWIDRYPRDRIMAHHVWTEEEVDALHSNAHLVLEEIEPLIPTRTRAAISKRLQRDGLFRPELHSFERKWPKPGDQNKFLTALKVEPRPYRDTQRTDVFVRCVCETEKWISLGAWNSGRTTSCGCKGKEKAGERMAELAKKRAARPGGEIGDVFDRLTVIGPKEMREYRGRRTTCVLCRCSCEKQSEDYYPLTNLRSGENKSCGCLTADLNRARATHGLTSHPLYHVWHDMHRRCYDPRSKGYKAYGKKGIRVCEEWHDLRTFVEWGESNGWEKGLTINRRNPRQNYGPANCNWLPKSRQGEDRTDNTLITYKGKTQSLSMWSRETGIHVSTICYRRKQGWPVERVFETPVQCHKRTDEFEFQGKSQTLEAWAEEMGLPIPILRNRIWFLKWPIEKALTTPLSRLGARWTEEEVGILKANLEKLPTELAEMLPGRTPGQISGKLRKLGFRKRK